MNPYYTLMESKHRWPILAGISFTAACAGAIMMIAWAWPHLVAQIWLYLGLLLTLLSLSSGGREWWISMRSASADTGRRRRTPGGATRSRPPARPVSDDRPQVR